MIEKDLTRIADALEKIASSPVMGNPATLKELAAPAGVSTPAKVPTPPKKPAKTAVVPTPPPSPPAAASDTNVVVVAAPPVETSVVLTAEELNAELGKEFVRLGNSEVGIRAAMTEMGVDRVVDLPAEKYGELLAKVRAL